MQDLTAFKASTVGTLHGLSTGLSEVSAKAHTHDNKAVLDNITQEMLDNISSISTVIGQAHWHHNLTILNGITQAKINEWDSVAALKTQMNSLSTNLTVVREKCDHNSSRISVNENDISTMKETISALQAEIENLDGKVQTVFTCGADTLERYAETVYTFYNDGYRNLPGFAQSYPNFCSAENEYSLNFNITDFGWAGVVYTMFLKPVKIESTSKIMLTYQSGATDIGEIYLVQKISGRSYSELASIIHDKIVNGTAIKLNFQWLQSNDFISVLADCGDLDMRDYYLAIKGVSDNTHPILKSIKVLGGL